MSFGSVKLSWRGVRVYGISWRNYDTENTAQEWFFRRGCVIGVGDKPLDFPSIFVLCVLWNQLSTLSSVTACSFISCRIGHIPANRSIPLPM
jgi:hypothetical protein